MKLPRISVLVILVVTAFGCATPAWAAFPGTNGSIAYVVEGPIAGERLIESAFLGPEGRLVPDTINLRSTGVDRGGDAFDPSLSADGRNLAFVSTRSGHSQIYSTGLNFSRGLVSFCGLEVCPLTSELVDSYEPAWSFDGQSIVFTSTSEGAPQIYRMTASGESVTRLTFDNATDQQPVWSPTGKIAFVSDQTGSPQIYVMNGQGGELQQVTQSGVNTDPSWAPSGKELVYASKTATGYQISVVGLAGGEPRRLGGLTSENRAPAWSPDGTKLLITRGPDLSGHYHLEVIGARSGVAFPGQSNLGLGEDGSWAPLPPAPPRNAPAATAGLTAIARPLGGKIGINPGHAQAGIQTGESSAPASEAPVSATPASLLTQSVEVPVNSTYNVTQGLIKLTIASPVRARMSTAIVTGGRFLLIQHGLNIPTIHLVGSPRGCRRRGRASIARLRGAQPHVRGHTKGVFKEVGRYGKISTRSTRWEIRNTCRGTLYRAIEDALTLTDPHLRHPVRVTAGHEYLVRPGR